MNKKLSLYSIASEMANITKVIEENLGEIPEDLEKRMCVIETQYPEKIDGYSQIMKRIDHEIAYYKEQSQTFSRAAKTFDNFKKRMKENIKQAMSMLNKDRLDGNSVYFKLGKSKAKLIIDESELPKEYLIQVTTYEPDKKRIREILEQGLDIPGAHLEESHTLRNYPKTTLNKDK